MLFCILGVILVVKPSFVFAYIGGKEFIFSQITLKDWIIFIGALILISFAIISLRYVMKDMSFDVVTFYYSIIGVLFGSILSF